MSPRLPSPDSPFSLRERTEIAEALKTASSNMIGPAVETMVRVRKGSRGHTNEEVMICIPRITRRNMRKGSLPVIAYLLARRKGREKAG
jgi:hypothetical protein